MKLVTLDNLHSYGQKLINQEMPFSFDGAVFYFGPMHSSLVLSIIRNKDIITVKTKNSTYTFEDIDYGI